MKKRPSNKRILNEVPIEYITCRTISHAWDEFHPMMRPPEFGWRLSLRCTRCTMERHDLISRVTFELLQRYYVPPEGYSMGYKVSLSELRKLLYLHGRQSASHIG